MPNLKTFSLPHLEPAECFEFREEIIAEIVCGERVICRSSEKALEK